MMKDMIKRVVDEMRWYRSEIDRGIKPTAYIQANSGVIGNGINTIEKLLEENQQLKSENERLHEAMNPNCTGCDSMHPDNGNCTAVGGFCTAVPAANCPLIPKLRAENAQLRRERDAAVADFETVCKETEDYRCCSFCKKLFTNCEKGCNPEWRGVQEVKA